MRTNRQTVTRWLIAVIPATVAELWMVLYLLGIGVRVRRQDTAPVEATAAAAGAQARG